MNKKLKPIFIVLNSRFFVVRLKPLFKSHLSKYCLKHYNWSGFMRMSMNTGLRSFSIGSLNMIELLGCEKILDCQPHMLVHHMEKRIGPAFHPFHVVVEVLWRMVQARVQVMRPSLTWCKEFIINFQSSLLFTKNLLLKRFNHLLTATLETVLVDICTWASTKASNYSELFSICVDIGVLTGKWILSETVVEAEGKLCRNIDNFPSD